MAILIAVLTLTLLVAVILVVSAPLRAPRHPPENGTAGGKVTLPGRGRGEPLRERGEPEEHGLEWAEQRSELEAARAAKYREIRDTELDYRTGKLSREDFAATDSSLRAEAVEILDRLAVLERREGARPKDA